MTDTKTPAKSTPAKATAAKADDTRPASTAPRVEHTDLPETDRIASGADRPLAKSTGEERPKEFGANEETYDSPTWAQTHGSNPLDDVHDLADY
jgi:hypothetical protein